MGGGLGRVADIWDDGVGRSAVGCDQPGFEFPVRNPRCWSGGGFGGNDLEDDPELLGEEAG